MSSSVCHSMTYDRLNEGPKAFSYHEWITKAGALYQLPVTSKCWLAKSTDKKMVLMSLMAKVDKLILHIQGSGRGCSRQGCNGGQGHSDGPSMDAKNGHVSAVV